jgi:hypothetical protein
MSEQDYRLIYCKDKAKSAKYGLIWQAPIILYIVAMLIKYIMDYNLFIIILLGISLMICLVAYTMLYFTKKYWDKEIERHKTHTEIAELLEELNAN